jgi:hypothetical protein
LPVQSTPSEDVFVEESTGLRGSRSTVGLGWAVLERERRWGHRPWPPELYCTGGLEDGAVVIIIAGAAALQRQYDLARDDGLE